jgi:SAM-dependent methyltransferase
MKNFHDQLVFKRRVRVLSRELAARLPRNASVLDIGCGSGDLAMAIMAKRSDVTIHGVDVLVRPAAVIPVEEYDGKTIPFADGSFDVAMLVDVLHHTDDPSLVLKEASRVASQAVLIKDHYRDGPVAGLILRFMDWIGNTSHGVRLPYNYLARWQWQAIWQRLDLAPNQVGENLRIYPRPFDFVFGRGLHFVALLGKTDTRTGRISGTSNTLTDACT